MDVLVVTSQREAQIQSTLGVRSMHGVVETKDRSVRVVYVGEFPDVHRLAGINVRTLVLAGNFDRETIEYLTTRVRDVTQ
ncbi:MAG: hypothetical protein ACPGVG_17420 [Mycobacterium sp.]